MNYEKQITRFLKRKPVINVLGKNYILNDLQYQRFCKLLDMYKTPKNMENMLTTVATFIKYDVSNYVGRYRRLVGTNGTSVYYQMLRYGRHYQDVYSKQTSSKIKHFKNTVGYWLNNGYTLEEAKSQVRAIQQARGLEAAKKIKGTSCYTVRSVEYWLNNGYTLEEARAKVKLIQTTNGIEFYKNKYSDNYKQKFDERIAEWKKSLLENNDMNFINLKKSHSIKGGLARGLTLDEASVIRDKNIRHMKSIRRLPSKISQKMCSMLFDKIGGKCYYESKNYEKLISGYRVDFYHYETDTVIEFYGDFFHRNPKMFESTHIAFSITAKERWEYDKHRISAIRKKVSNVIIVWESDFRKNPSAVVDKIIKEMT
jgi:very-short-patch-repair endonuclease